MVRPGTENIGTDTGTTQFNNIQRVQRKSYDEENEERRRKVKLINTVRRNRLAKKGVKLKKLSALGKGSTITISGWISLFHFFLGILAAAVFFTEDSWLGFAIPGETLGLFFWGISALLTVIGYLALVAFFQITGSKSLSTYNRLFIFIFCFTFDFLPFTNIFPWIFVWVLFINTLSVAQLVRKT